MATIYIDDIPYEAEAGENILKAVLGLGLDLPYFCWHPEMGSVGACRQCALVQYRDEEDTRGRIVMGCMTPVTDGARFSMEGEAPKEFRENVVESLMLNHPHDCPVCAEGGECHLQDMTVMVGHRDRRYRGKKNTHRNQDLGPLVHHEMNRCISCYRCTRYYNDYAGGTDLSAQAAHDHVYFGRHEDGTLESEFAGNLVEVCPTGVFTDKPLVNEYTRKWDLQSAPSVCTGCALGCNILPGERYGKLKRVHNRYNNEVNGYFLCDRGRYGANYVNNEQRAQYAGLKDDDGRYNAIEETQALSTLKDWCAQDSAIGKLAGIGSPRASLESNYLLKELVGADNFCAGFSDHESELIGEVRKTLSQGSVSTPSLKQVEDADAILILGEDVTNTAPRLAFSLRQSVRNLAKQMASDMRIPLWQDEAVRNLAQDKLSPMHIVAMADTRLSDVAASNTSMPPNEIARLGYAIAAEIDSSLPSVAGVDQATQDLIRQIANDLKSANCPLVVSGTGCQNLAVIQAASAIAEALKSANESTMLSYCLPEANSMGVSMLQDQSQVSLHHLSQRVQSGAINTLVILENDLYRRAPEALVDEILSKVAKVIVLDSVDTPTLSQSSLALPAASFAESEGTLVSSEGRAQRHYPVFLGAEQIKPSWQWLTLLGQALNKDKFNAIKHFDDVCSACANDNPALQEIVNASPSAEFRDRGMKIPRQTHRYSGRTAMLADISVHEPKQPEDADTPLSYSMEGANGVQKPGALLPFVWSPGWNSNQSLHKFQSEAGGALTGGTAGVRLIEANNGAGSSSSKTAPEADHNTNEGYHLLPLYRIFGSDQLSAQSPAIRELTKHASIELNADDASKLALVDGDLITVVADQSNCVLQLIINPSIPSGCAGYTSGVPGAAWFAADAVAALSKAPNQIITEAGVSSTASTSGGQS